MLILPSMYQSTILGTSVLRQPVLFDPLQRVPPGFLYP